jgi:hypothetical protein
MTTRRRKKHRPEEVVAKLRDADAMLNAGKDLAAVLQALAVNSQPLSLRMLSGTPRRTNRSLSRSSTSSLVSLRAKGSQRLPDSAASRSAGQNQPP